MTINYNDIKEICVQLSANNEEVTADKVLAQTSGSIAAVLKYYRQWSDTEQVSLTEQAETQISEEYLSALQNEISRFSRVEIDEISSKLKSAQEIENIALTVLANSEEELSTQKECVENIQNQLSETVSQYDADILTLKDNHTLTINQLEDKTQELENNNKILSLQVDELNESHALTINQLEDENKSLSIQTDELNKQLQNLEADLTLSYEAKLSSLSEELTAVTLVAESAKKDLSLAVKKLSAEHERYNEELISQHDSKIDELHERNRQKMAKLLVSHEETIVILNQTNEEHIEELTSRHEKQNRTLVKKHNDARLVIEQENENVDAEAVSAYQEEIKQLQDQLTQLNERYDGKTAELEQKLDEVTANSADEISQLKSSNELAIKELTDSNALQLDQAGQGNLDEISSLSSTVDEKSLEITNLQEEVAKNKSLITSLETQLAESESSAAIESESMSDSRSTVDELTQSLASANENIIQLQEKADKAMADLEEYKSTIADQQKASEQTNDDSANNEQALLDLREENEQLGVQMNFIKNSSIATLERLTNNSEQDKETIKNLEQQLAKATEDTKQARTDKTKLAEQVDFMKHNSTTTFERLTNKAEKYASKIKSLEEELAQIKV